MKKTEFFTKIILLSFFLLVVTIHVTAQKVTLSYKNVPFEKVLNSIKQQTGLALVFSEQLVDVNRKVSINATSVELKDVLKQLLAETNVDFEIKNNKLYLVEKKIVEPQISPNQSKKISGLVTDEKGEPIIGASVVLKGSNTGTITNIDGMFALEVKEQSEILISYIGYQQTILKTGKANSYKVTLEEASKSLDEVVVVGYGTQKKSSMTAAVTTLNPNEMVKVTKPNVYSALQGRIAGLTVTETSGDPDSSPTLLLRGKGTIDGSTSPLILVDGVPTATLNQIPAYDIESISVLKDASAAAIYGARAANGVILVTTKQGLKDDKKPIIRFNSYVGMQTLAQFPESMNSTQFAAMINEIAQNEGRGEYAIFSADDLRKFKNGEYDDFHANTNWKSEAINNVAPIHTNHLSVSGSHKLGNYYISGEYMNQTGMVKNIDKNDRINLRANITSNISDRLQFKYSTNYIRTNRISGGLASIFSSVLTTPPTVPVRYSDGHWGTMAFASDAFLRNTANVVQNITDYGNRDIYWNTLNTSAEFIFTPVKDLVLRAMGTYRNSQSDSQIYEKSWISWNPLTQSIAQSGVASLNESWSKEYKYDFQATATYEKNIDKNYFKILAGVSSESLRSDWVKAYRKNFINDYIYELNAGDAATQTNSGGADQWSFASLFGRINYAFDNRYLLEASFRRDGSSRFAPGKQWGTFPSFSVGWNINKEDFMERFSSVLDMLRVRLSWGQLGNAEKVGLYLWYDGVSSGSYYNFDGTLVTGTRPADPSNKNLTWETTTSYNAGFDGSFLNGKYTFEFDLWRKNTDGILLTVPISTIVGSTNASQTVNAGKVASHGIDLSVGTKGNFSKDFTYGVRLSFTGWNSWVDDLQNRASAFSTEFRPGEELGNFYGYQCLGIINDDATLDVYKKIENVAPQTDLGDLEYKDQNGDGRLDYMDIVKIGNYNTKNNFGLNTEFGFKNFDMQIFFQGAFNVDKILDGSTRSTGTYNSSDLNKLDRWTTENRNADALYPRLRREYTHNTSTLSSFWVKDASYIKIKNLQLGYNFPKTFLSKTGIQNLRIYLSGTNLFTFAPNYLEGYDPEVDMKTDIYPTLRVYSFGLNLQF